MEANLSLPQQQWHLVGVMFLQVARRQSSIIYQQRRLIVKSSIALKKHGKSNFLPGLCVCRSQQQPLAGGTQSCCSQEQQKQPPALQ